MLCNGCYKLLRCVYLKILLAIITMAHLRAVDNCSGLIDICQLLNREGIADNVLGQGLPTLIIISSNSYTVVDTEARMSPAHKPID